MTLPSFPSLPGLDWGIKRSPAGASVRQEALNGKRTILPQRATPRWSWELPFEFLRSAAWGDGTYSELETLTGFYLAQMMSGGAFGYTEPSDSVATAQGFGTGDGTTTQFQLVRSRGGFAEPVYLPTITTLTVGGVTKVQGTDFTLGSTGIVTFGAAPAPAAALVWTGTYQWLCRFDDDSLNLAEFMQGMSEAKSLKFSSEISP